MEYILITVNFANGNLLNAWKCIILWYKKVNREAKLFFNNTFCHTWCDEVQAFTVKAVPSNTNIHAHIHIHTYTHTHKKTHKHHEKSTLIYFCSSPIVLVSTAFPRMCDSANIVRHHVVSHRIVKHCIVSRCIF